MIIKKNKDNTLTFLIMISFINLVVMFLGEPLLKLKYLLLILNFIVIISSNVEKTFPLLLFLHPNSALYDDIGFTYLFNFSIVILTMKLLFKRNNKISKSSFLLFGILISWEVVLILKSNILDYKLLSLGSWACSYIILIILSRKENVDFCIIYKYFFWGFFMAFICGISIPINKWGIGNIPTAYRFIGLLRDPNYYSMDALLLIFSSRLYCKLSNKKEIFYIITIFIMGVLSISKTFIFLFSVGVIIKLLYKIRHINPFKLVGGISISILIYFTLNKLGYVQLFIEKYLYRTETTSLFTGRDYLFSYYVSAIFSKPFSLIFGNSALKYSSVLNVGLDNNYFTNFVAHNTYLDIILAWGIFGTILYILFIFSIFRNAKLSREYSNKNKINFEKVILIIIFLLSLFTLSYLTTDVFALIILYLITYLYNDVSDFSSIERIESNDI